MKTSNAEGVPHRSAAPGGPPRAHRSVFPPHPARAADHSWAFPRSLSPPATRLGHHGSPHRPAGSAAAAGLVPNQVPRVGAAHGGRRSEPLRRTPGQAEGVPRCADGPDSLKGARGGIGRGLSASCRKLCGFEGRPLPRSPLRAANACGPTTPACSRHSGPGAAAGRARAASSRC